MNITFITKPSNGCTLHRIVLPADHTEWQSGDTVQMVDESDYQSILAPDIIVVNHTILNVPAEWLIEKKEFGCKIIVDIDDWWHLPSSHSFYDWWYIYGVDKMHEQYLAAADLVTCTNFQLRDAVLPFNKNCIVIPNALPFGLNGYNDDYKIKSDKTRFIYAAGENHLQDVRLLANTFVRCGFEDYIKSNSEFILAGYHSNAVYSNWDGMKGVFALTKASKIIYNRPICSTNPDASPDDYMTVYDEADVALIPLVRNTHNSCKSILKVIEAVSRNLPVICSSVLPYTELATFPGIMWVNKASDWLTHIRYCIKNPAFVKESGMALAEQIKKSYDLRDWNKVRYDIYKHLIAN